MMIYHYTKFDFALDDIKNQYIKICTLDSVNDPYEWVPCVLDDNGQPLDPEIIRTEWLKKYSARVGFVSFSTAITSPAMWGYYGNKHNGAALGFNLQKLPLKMNYTNSRVNVFSRDLVNGSDILTNVFDELVKQKGACWQHEEEYRIVVHIPTSATLKKENCWFTTIKNTFDLQRVVLGYKCSEKHACDMRNVLDSAGLSHVRVYGSRICKADFLIDSYEWM